MGGMVTGALVSDNAQAFKCGADLLLWPPIEAADRIEEMILSGEIPMSRLDEALERIDAMLAFRYDALENHSYQAPDCAYAEEKSAELTEMGICCLKNAESLLPLDAKKHKTVLIMDATEEHDCGSTGFLKKELESRGMEVTVARGGYDKISLVWWQEDVDRMQEGQDLVIFNLNSVYLSSLNNAFMTIWGSHMFDKKKKLIVNYGSPFFAPECFPEDPTIVEMNCNASEFAAKALAVRLFGEKEFTGKPVIQNGETKKIKA